MALPLHPPDATIHLPDGTEMSLTYLAEGGAHILYIPSPLSPSSPTSVPFSTIFDSHLLRFRKSGSGPSCAQRVSDFQTRIVGLVPAENLLQLSLHTLGTETQGKMLADLTASLRRREAEGLRPAGRCGAYLPPVTEEPDFVLVRDLRRARDGQEAGERLVEFKPKWLLQSPSAPKGAKRCRTCALREMRQADKGDGDGGIGGRELMPFCPMDLLSADEGMMNRVLGGLGFPGLVKQEMRVQFRTAVQPLLRRLRDLQAVYGGVGLEDFRDRPGQDFSLAMALRDCSLFVRVGEDGKTFKEVLLADVDLKKGDAGKLKHWIGTESRLIDEGWYMSEEESMSSREHSLCQVGLT